MRARTRPGALLATLAALVLAIGGGLFLWGWYGPGPLRQTKTIVVPTGATMAQVADQLERAGAISSSRGFRLRARVLGDGGSGIKAGEFSLPAHASAARILHIIESSQFVSHVVVIPEGMPAILVAERLRAQPLLTGAVAVPAEGSVLPDTYGFERGETRAAVLARMQRAMTRTVKEAWANRAKGLAVINPEQAVTLASIVEKETGKPAERPTVAALYANRLRRGMPLQADPTIIYPITQGKPLGRRILRSEIAAVNGYNTYSMVGLPKGPITNPGRASLNAVLHPAQSGALYMVADGTGGHAFAATLDEHNRNVAKWFAIRKARGELN